MEDLEVITVEETKALSRRALEMWTSGSSDEPTKIFATNYINYQEPAAAGGVRGLDLHSWLSAVREHRLAFPDTAVEILIQIAEGNFAASHWRFTATSTGTYFGHPPTGKEIVWTGVQIDRFEDNKIAESWVSWDKFTLFEGLGLVN
jgi:predicted ester cyclase